MAELLRFGDFELDRTHFELRSDGRIIPVEPLVFDLIAMLAERQGEVLSRDALIEGVWSGRIVSDSTVSTAIKSARRALGDSGETQRYIRTVRGRGIQFVADVSPDEAAAAPAAPAQDPTLYVRTESDPDDAALASTLRSRLSTVLGRVPLLRIATPFPRADAIGDPRELGRDVGATLLLQVRVARQPDGVRADVSLTGTRDGLQIWAASIETSDAEALIHPLVARAEPRIVQAMIDDLRQRDDISARHLVLEAAALLALKGWNGETFDGAERFLEDAARTEPDLALAHALLALVRALGHRLGTRSDAEAAAGAIRAADRALALDGADSAVLGLAGCALSDAGEVDRAVPILRRAISLDPANAQARTALGAAMMARRDFDEAARWLEDGMRISPADTRLSVWGGLLAIVELARGDRAKALAAAEDACAHDDRNYLPRLALAAVHAASGHEPGLGAAVRDCLRTHPAITEDEVRSVLGRNLGALVWEGVTRQREALAP